MVVLDREAVRRDVLGNDEMIVGDELLTDPQRLEGELLELDECSGSCHAAPPTRARSIAPVPRTFVDARGGRRCVRLSMRAA